MENNTIERVKLPTLIGILKEHRYNNKNIADILGITPLQVHYYFNGKTKNPSPIIVMKLLTKFKINGVRYLVDTYRDFSDLEQHYNIVTKSYLGAGNGK